MSQTSQTSQTSLIINNTGSDTLVVSFAGHDLVFGLIPRFEFFNFFEKHFTHIDRHFYVDMSKASYHKGITGITTTIDETVAYLKEKIAPYKTVLFLGISSGGYAAILFGSLLRVTSVFAFIPQTHLRERVTNESYRDIAPYINDTTVYELYGDLSAKNEKGFHHISHCERIGHHKNVTIIRQPNFNLKRMRDNGELYAIITRLLTNPA